MRNSPADMDIDIVPELKLLDAVTARARADAMSKCDYLRVPAIIWLNNVRLPVDGPRQPCQIETRRRMRRAR